MVILTAVDLSPSDTAQIDSDKVLAFVTRDGGRTSHTAIIARSMELPAVVGAEEILNKAKNGDKVIVDCIDGDIIIEALCLQKKNSLKHINMQQKK